jgi:hypothetical protein
MSYGAVSLTTDAVATIVTANVERVSLIITNIGSGKAFLAEDASVTSGNGILVMSNGTFTEDSGGTRMYLGPVYGMAGSLGTVVTFWQRTR